MQLVLHIIWSVQPYDVKTPPPPPPPPPGLMRKEHPGVALSVKTHQAIRSVLNHCRDTIKHLLEGGLLDETDAEKLFQVMNDLIWQGGLCTKARD